MTASMIFDGSAVDILNPAGSPISDGVSPASVIQAFTIPDPSYGNAASSVDVRICDTSTTNAVEFGSMFFGSALAVTGKGLQGL